MTKLKSSLSAYLRVDIIWWGLQLGEDIGLTQREHSIFGIGVELYYHVLDLYGRE